MTMTKSEINCWKKKKKKYCTQVEDGGVMYECKNGFS